MIGIAVKKIYVLIAITLLWTSMAIAQQAKPEIKLVPINLVKFDKKNMQCAIVKVHSLMKTAEGKVFRQEGLGWIIRLGFQVGVLTPYHVVASGESIIAECNGNFFPVVFPTIDREKDLAFFRIQDDQLEKNKQHLLPLLVQQLPEEKSVLDEKGKALDQLLNLNFPREYYRTKALELALGSASFGVASMPTSQDPASALIMSPDMDLNVQVQVDKNHPFYSNLIRVQGLGVRPGISGGALFGVAYSSLYAGYNFQKNKSEYEAPIELLPKIILGMVTKTRINGAETVAISMEDILTFLETEALKIKYKTPKKNLEIHYAPQEKNNEFKLKTYLTIHQDHSPQETIISEFCSDEYQVSAEWSPLEPKMTLQSLPRKEQKILEAKRDLEIKRKDQMLQIYQTDHGRAVNTEFLKEIKLTPEQKRQLLSSGGGDYGEGGDGFLLPESQFILTSFAPNDFDGVKKVGVVKISQFKSIPSLGLYKTPRACRQQGLMVGQSLISQVALPNQDLRRMVNLEDFYAFYKENKEKSLDLLLQYGSNSDVGMSLPVPKDLKLEIPLVPVFHISSGNIYSKTFLTRAKANSDSPSKLELTRNGLQLVADTKLPDGKETMRLHIKQSQNIWSGSLQFSNGCRIEMNPGSFKKANNWSANYKDASLDMGISLLAQSESMRVVINKINSQCADVKNLALTELEIQLNGTVTAVIGTPRTALIMEPTNLQSLIKEYGKNL